MKREEVNFHPEYEGQNICEFMEKDGVVWIEFTPFQKIDGLVHGFSTRIGGVSRDEFASMNLSYSRGDKKEHVDENYEIICRALNIVREELVFSDQVHDTRLAYADGSVKQYEGTDGLFTDQNNVVLTTSYADCVPLFFVDPVKHIIASSHSGWRGTCGKIGAKTVDEMAGRFGCRREDILAIIGPSICKDCYEVSKDVADAFKKIIKEENQGEVIFPDGNEKYHLDLWKANQLILQESGLCCDKIHVAGLCTCCNADLLFSHRKSHGKRGNLNGFLGLQ